MRLFFFICLICCCFGIYQSEVEFHPKDGIISNPNPGCTAGMTFDSKGYLLNARGTVPRENAPGVVVREEHGGEETGGVVVDHPLALACKNDIIYVYTGSMFYNSFLKTNSIIFNKKTTLITNKTKQNKMSETNGIVTFKDITKKKFTSGDSFPAVKLSTTVAGKKLNRCFGSSTTKQTNTI